MGLAVWICQPIRRRHYHWPLLLLVGASLLLVCIPSSSEEGWGPGSHCNADRSAQTALKAHSTPFLRYKIVNIYPHDHTAFTQGLVFDRGVLYESTGLYGQSEVRRVALESGAVLRSVALPDRLFGEGITLFGDRLIQLTWKSGVGVVYDKTELQVIKTFNYATEGWGITHNGHQLIMSDGSETLYFLDPDKLNAIKAVRVHDDCGPVRGLNELEYIQGRVFANIWQRDYIALINPETGKVKSWLDLVGLRENMEPSHSLGVLNGIAYDSVADRLVVTGKNWPKLFEIRVIAE